MKTWRKFLLLPLAVICLAFCACNDDEDDHYIANKTISFSEMMSMYDIGNIEKIKIICRGAGYGKVKDTSTYQNQVCVYRKYVENTYYVLCIYSVRDSLYQMNQYIIHNDNSELINQFKSLSDTINGSYGNSFQISSLTYLGGNYYQTQWEDFPSYQLFSSKFKSLNSSDIINAGLYYLIKSLQRNITLEYKNTLINFSNYGVDLIDKGEKMINIQISGPSYRNE